MIKKHVFRIFLVLSLIIIVSCGAGGEDDPGNTDLKPAVWDSSNWDASKWQ